MNHNANSPPVLPQITAEDTRKTIKKHWVWLVKLCRSYSYMHECLTEIYRWTIIRGRLLLCYPKKHNQFSLCRISTFMYSHLCSALAVFPSHPPTPAHPPSLPMRWSLFEIPSTINPPLWHWLSLKTQSLSKIYCKLNAPCGKDYCGQCWWNCVEKWCFISLFFFFFTHFIVFLFKSYGHSNQSTVILTTRSLFSTLFSGLRSVEPEKTTLHHQHILR